MESVKLKPSAFVIQVWGTCCICFLACQTGFISAWPSATIAIFQSNDTVLSKPMTSLEISLLGSLTNVGALVATPFCGYAFNTFGRKYASMLFALPFVLSWTIISFTTHVTLVLLAIAIAGIGIAGQNVSLIYISEISHDSIRGGMTACSATGYFIGLLVAYTFGGYMTYYQTVYTNLSLAVLAIVLLMLLHESPVFLVLAGKEKEAAKSIAFYNRVAVDSKEVEIEIKRIKIQLDPRLEKMLEGQEDPEVSSGLLNEKLGVDIETNSESSWKILRSSKSSKRALIRVVILMALSVFMGGAVLQIYAEPLFKEAVPSMSANLCSILLAVDYLVASFVCVFAIDKYGRKILFIITSGASGVCTLLLGAQLYLHFAPHWFTVFLIFAYSFVYTVGCAVIPFVLTAEVFLPEVRSLCSSIVMVLLWISLFVTLFVFYPLVELLGLGPVFCCFSVICFAGAAYAHFKLPETKGLSADAIQAKFLKTK